MAATYLTATGAQIGTMSSTAGEESSRPKLQTSVSIIVDDVDSDNSSSAMDTPFIQFRLNDADIYDQFVNNASKIEYESRLEKIREEIRHRRNEFARLLDEHEQVIREIHRIESSGELRALQETSHLTPSDNSQEE